MATTIQLILIYDWFMIDLWLILGTSSVSPRWWPSWLMRHLAKRLAISSRKSRRPSFLHLKPLTAKIASWNALSFSVDVGKTNESEPPVGRMVHQFGEEHWFSEWGSGHVPVCSGLCWLYKCECLGHMLNLICEDFFFLRRNFTKFKEPSLGTKEILEPSFCASRLATHKVLSLGWRKYSRNHLQVMQRFPQCTTNDVTINNYIVHSK